MIIKLKPDEYPIIAQIDQPKQIKIMIESIIAGNSEGGIWVDDLVNPTAMFASVLQKHYRILEKSYLIDLF